MLTLPNSLQLSTSGAIKIRIKNTLVAANNHIQNFENSIRENSKNIMSRTDKDCDERHHS
jgi:ElaB/YqjD/DUF883 family membrane-anchored ribosome-binding protein